MRHFSTISIIACLAWTGSAVIGPAPGYAQDKARETGRGQEAAAGHETTGAEAPNTLSKIREEMAELKETLDRQSHEIETLKKQRVEQEEKNKALESDLSDLEDNIELAAVDESEVLDTERLLSIFGFFDLTFFKGFYEDNNLYAIYVPARSTFVMTNVNVYFKSEMTSQLSALLELRFSFLPHGKETSMEAQTVLPDGTVIDVPQEYERVDTTVMDPVTTMEFRQGGVTLERVHLTYSPFDWFNVIAGRYLSPFGIWNVDHGSPVVIPARIPMLQYRELVPLAQTGLQVYGRFFPTDTLLIDYAVTLSNGRGPLETVYDLDEDKGVGLRLKLTYTGRKVTFFAGAYGYTGESTDIKKQIVAPINENNEMVLSGDDATRLRIIKTNAFRELTMTYDASLSFFGVTLQVEGAVTRVLYSKNRALEDVDASFNGGTMTEQWYMPSYTGYDVYVLAAYELPLPISWLRVTPYVVLEKSIPNDVLKVGNLESVTGGLNLRPSPYVSIKGEYMLTHIKILGESHTMTFQLAVSF